jgi:hypothetical protein
MFAYMKLRLWENVELDQVGNYRLPLPSRLHPPGNGSIGMIEVYDTKENAIKAGCEPSLLVEVRESRV